MNDFRIGYHVFQHILPLRVYYDDTDASGILHHSNYLKFFERGRTEALREQGFELPTLYEQYGIQFVVHSANLNFLQSARLDQLLYVITQIDSFRPASVLYNQRIHLNAPTGLLLCEAKLRLACLNKAFKPCALPDVLLKEKKNDNRYLFA